MEVADRLVRAEALVVARADVEVVVAAAVEEEWEEIRSILDLCLNALFSRIEEAS